MGQQRSIKNVMADANSKALKNKLTLVILGRSGSGKGTQADFIIQRLKKDGVCHLETGRFLRKLIKKSNPTTNILRNDMLCGKLAPSWLAAHLWLKQLIEGGYANKHLVFDGAPRRIWEAELIDEVMLWHKRSSPVCIFIDVTVKEGTRRLLLRGRKDDKPAAIKNRMKFFDKNVLPVLRFYKKEGRLIHINGNPSADIVWREIDKKLAENFDRRWPRK